MVYPGYFGPLFSGLSFVRQDKVFDLPLGFRVLRSQEKRCLKDPLYVIFKC